MNPPVFPLHFTLAFWCVLVAALLPLLCAFFAKSNLLAGPGDASYDNNEPRIWFARQSGARSRANAAQTNSFEGLPFFIGAVIVAHLLGAPQWPLDLLAVAYIVLRLVFIAAYISGHSSLRSVAWVLGLVANLAILLMGYR